MTDRRARIRLQLAELEQRLRGLGFWADQPPAPDRLASKLPFCYDTLTLPEWLQWVFRVRLIEVLDKDQPLPEKCAIAPLAEEWFRAQGTGLDAAPLLEILDSLDELLSSRPH